MKTRTGIQLRARIEEGMNPRPHHWGVSYRPAGKLRDRVAVITSGESGIGRAVAVLFAREGADVALIHRTEDEDDAAEVCEVIRNCGRRAVSIAGDVSRPEFCDEAVARCLKVLGRLDILVNNAAIPKQRDYSESLGIADWERSYKVNIHSYFYMTKAALGFLGDGSAIVNTGSIAGLEGSPDLRDYAATQGAIHAFTKSLARALVKRGIRVNCVAPGPDWTPLTAVGSDPSERVEYGPGNPFGRPAHPEEIAPTYVYLSSNPDSSYLTGQVITPLGGEIRAGWL